jgi:hypothetical protein
MERPDGSERSREGLDLRLREALEPRPEAVERIVRGALAGPRSTRRKRLVPLASVLAVLLAAAALLVSGPRPKPQEASVSIENVGDVLVVRSREGGRLLLHNGEAGARSSSPSGSLIVIYGGDR